MRVIRLTKYSMLRKLWAWSVILVFLCALPFIAWAEKPPQSLMERVSASPIVHDKKCNFQSMKHVECIITYDEQNDLVWLVLFDDSLEITLVVLVKDKQEVVAWCRQDVCL